MSNTTEIITYVSDEQFERLKDRYNEINNSFRETAIYRVGESQGFHSEVDAMMQSMLYCYHNKIKFVLYGESANFASEGNGWKEFFESFCEENSDKENMLFNRRHELSWKHPLWKLRSHLFKKKNNAQYLNQDIFFKAIGEEFNKIKVREWKEFGINGIAEEQWIRFAPIALRYNKQTKLEVEEKIKSVNLPQEYASVQIRQGDKNIEFDRLITCEDIIDGIEKKGIEIKNLFIFADDYRSIIKMRELRPDWNIYTLTREDERGYYNAEFQKKEWSQKRADTIKMFAMIDICIKSKIHLGCNQSCTNNYIKNIKTKDSYISINEE